MASLIFIAAGLGCEKGVKRPFPEVVEATAYDGAPGFDYTVWVECTIRNSGADGSVEVLAELWNVRTGRGLWQKRQAVFMVGDSEKRVTSAFPQPTFLGAGLGGGLTGYEGANLSAYQYNCAAR